MIGEILFWAGLLVALSIGLAYFRDLGDVSQMIMRVKRVNTIRFIRNEYRILAVGLLGIASMGVAHLAIGAGPAWLFWGALALLAVLYAFPYVWVHLGLRNQAGTASFYSLAEAANYVAPASQVLVIEKDGIARAHPDHEPMRPHLAGNDDGLGGENVIMTYCAMANLGVGYTPEIAGDRLDLEVLAQHGNNLILRDNITREPIQQIYGARERDGRSGPAMAPWPTFRMTFRGFQKAYPDGTVYLNRPSKNPLLRLLDLVLEMVFGYGISRQHREQKPVMDNMSHSDDRLPNKTYVWGINIGDDAVCYTQNFLVEQGNVVNVEIGGRALVMAWDPGYESVGAYYNDSATRVAEIDFYGQSDQGRLARVEVLKPGMFWHVWAEFYPHTDINRTVSPQTQVA